jgi:hypothetical protein
MHINRTTETAIKVDAHEIVNKPVKARDLDMRQLVELAKPCKSFCYVIMCIRLSSNRSHTGDCKENHDGRSHHHREPAKW